MSDPFLSPPAQPSQRPPSPRVVLWDELMHTQLGLLPPAETYTLEELEEVVADRRALLQQRNDA